MWELERQYAQSTTDYDCISTVIGGQQMGYGGVLESYSHGDVVGAARKKEKILTEKID